MRKLMFSLGLIFTCSLVQAADNGFYIGAGVTQAKLNDIGQGFDTGDLNDFDIDNTAWKLIAGFRPIDLFAIELNYDDLGDEGRTVGGVKFDADAKAFAAYAVGFLPITLVDIYGKVGLARWDTSASASGLFDVDENGTEFAYGAGVQVRLGSLGARLEYERFDIENTDGVEVLTLGATWTFF